MASIKNNAHHRQFKFSRNEQLMKRRVTDWARHFFLFWWWYKRKRRNRLLLLSKLKREKKGKYYDYVIESSVTRLDSTRGGSLPHTHTGIGEEGRRLLLRGPPSRVTIAFPPSPVMQSNRRASSSSLFYRHNLQSHPVPTIFFFFFWKMEETGRNEVSHVIRRRWQRRDQTVGTMTTNQLRRWHIRSVFSNICTRRRDETREIIIFFSFFPPPDRRCGGAQCGYLSLCLWHVIVISLTLFYVPWVVYINGKKKRG